MIVDDAVVVRGLFARWVEAEPDLEVVASLRTGRDAVDQIERADPDVVLLDVDMPDLDGIDRAAAASGKEARPGRDHGLDADAAKRRDQPARRCRSAPPIISRNRSTNGEITGSPAFRRELIEKIRQLGLRAKRLRVARTLGARRRRAQGLHRRCRRSSCRA